MQQLMYQTKLTINQPGDRFEQQADRVADAVMRMPEPRNPQGIGISASIAVPRLQRMRPEGQEELHDSPGPIQRLCSECEEEHNRESEEELDLKAKEIPGRTPEVTPAVQIRVDTLQGGGHPLPDSERAFFEPRFGRDFGQVRLHTDSRAADSARMVQARAFTMGRNVVLGAGEYTPGTAAGRRLLAHELTHVIQQSARGRDQRPLVQRQEPVTTTAAGLTIGAVVGKCILGAIAGALFDAAIQAVLYSIKEWTWRFWRASWDYCSLILSAAIGCIAAPISAATLEPWLAARLGPALGGIEGTVLGKLLLWLAKSLLLAPPKFIVKSLAKLGCISPEQAAALGVQRDSPEEPVPPTPVPLPPATTACKPMAGDVAGDARILMKVNTAELLSPDEEVKLDKFADSVRASGLKVKVHGLASTDGPANFNDRLSCTRALRATQLLRERGIPGSQIVDVFKHGEVSGPYQWQRSAVFEMVGTAPGSPPTPPGPTPTPPTPGPTAAMVKLKSLRFTSDHGVLKNNRDDWGDSGSRFSEPEWEVKTADRGSAPISHTKGQTVLVRVVLDVSSDAGAPTPFVLRGEGPEAFLSFDASGVLSSGEQEVVLNSRKPLPDEIGAFLQQAILWSVEINKRRQLIGLTFNHDVFVTCGQPSGGATYKRMATAVNLTKGFGKNPHDIVGGQMKRFPFYNLKNPIRGNIWVLADEIPAFGGKGADCQSIVRFLMAVNSVIALPGQARGISVYASPAAPTTPLEGDLVEGGGATKGMWLFHNVGLFDADDNFNNYEAALEFTNGSGGLFPDRERFTRYYPGGVPGGAALKSKEEVLQVFKRMAEAGLINGEWRPIRTIWCYEKKAKQC
ncbi:MAG TPA: DUF4157 domain-containing protein [Verrucomicrobiae bacterium]